MQENESIPNLAFFDAIPDAAEVFIKLTIIMDGHWSVREHFQFFQMTENFNSTGRHKHFGL